MAGMAGFMAGMAEFMLQPLPQERPRPITGRLYTVVWEPTEENCERFEGGWHNVTEWVQSQGASVATTEEVLLAMPTDIDETNGFWNMLVLWPAYSPQYRKRVKIAPCQLTPIEIVKPVWVWKRPREEEVAERGGLYSHETHELCEDPKSVDAFIMSCIHWPHGQCHASHSGWCRVRVESLLRDQDVVQDIIAAILDWQSQGQPCMWCHCKSGKHRSQAARSIVRIFTGAFSARERPMLPGWCRCEEMDAGTLCHILG